MGKRSDFKRNKADKYRTPPEGMFPLRPYLKPGATFIDPCAGDGRIARHIPGCVQQFDLEPDDLFMAIGDALSAVLVPCDYICTNPPWSRNVLHPMITRFRQHAPTWLLFDADWAYTKQAAPFMIYCRYVVAVGRLKWFPDSKDHGKDSCAWYLFLPHPTPTEFISR